MDGATTVMAKLTGVDSIWVRWPNRGGTSTVVPVSPSQTELTVRAPH